MEVFESSNSIAPSSARPYHDDEMTLEERGSGSTDQDQTTYGCIKKPTRRCFIPLWFYPLATSISIPFACIVSYLIYLDSTEDKSSSWTDDFPFISDTGIYPPASCWFTLLFFFVGFFSFSSALVRYMQLKTECRGRRYVKILNMITFIAGCTSSVGVIIVAAFQYDRSLVIHLVGAGLAFGVACIFFILQTVMSFITQKLHGNILHVILRICKIFLNVFHVVVAIPFLIFSFEYFMGNKYGQREKAAICEWILALSLSLYPLTIIPEVKQFSVQTKLKRTVEIDHVNCCIYIE